MKICILTPRFPYPQLGGDALRINEIARYLKRRGHQLILVSLSDDPHPDTTAALLLYDQVYVVPRKPLVSYFFSLLYFLIGRPMQCGYYRSAAYLSLLSQVVAEQKPDLYVCHLLRMVPYVEQLGLEDKSIVEMTDTLSKTYAISLSAENVGFLKYIYAIEQRLIKKYEIYVARRFHKIVLVSKGDADYLIQQDASVQDHVRIRTNGVVLPEIETGYYDSNKIVFIGNMRTIQNQDAVLYFAKYVLPLICEKNPKTVFHIVGALPPARINDLESENIRITGFVKDLESYISDACLSVAPIHVAAGIQNKVLVAMSCRVPVILSSLISRSMPQLENWKNCIIEDNIEAIANYCILLMKDSFLRNKIGQQGYSMVREHYSWNNKLAGYEYF